VQKYTKKSATKAKLLVIPSATGDINRIMAIKQKGALC
jgi:hypothetical protein